MYLRYALRRVATGVWIFIVLIFVYSAIFNTVLNATIEGQIQETVMAAMSSLESGDPAEAVAFKKGLTEALRRKYHMDDPFLVRVFWRAFETLTLQFGNSSTITTTDADPKVTAIIAERLPNTLVLFLLAAAINAVISIVLGLRKAQRPNGKLDRITSIITMLVIGLPPWWLGMILLMFFAYTIPIFPSSGMHSVPPPSGLAYTVDFFKHLALPVIVLVLVGLWNGAYLTRNIVLGTLQEDFVMSARARGLPERTVIYGHTLRTASPPILTMSVMSLTNAFSGSLFFEPIFNWPGMGSLFVIGVRSNDIPLIMGNLAVTTALFLLGLTVLDLVYGFLDPRVRAGSKPLGLEV